MASARPTVFISYSHADESWKDRLVKQLGVLENELDVWLLDIALDHLTLGRAHLGLALTSEASPDFKEAEEHLDRAVDFLRQAGRDDYLPRGLLARATLRRFRGSPDAGSPDGAASDLREAQDIAERGHMRLHEADVNLEWL